jgi:hypothetical protein
VSADISANIDCISAKPIYSSRMAKRNNKVGADHPFFRLIGDFSSLLASARSDEIEKALDDCLAKLGGHFGVQRVALGQTSKSGALPTSRRFLNAL